MLVLKTILVATDFSEPSTKALAYGRDLARSYNATLHVLHVTEDIMLRYAPEVGFAVPEMQRDLDRAARHELEQLITDDDTRTLRVVDGKLTAQRVDRLLEMKFNFMIDVGLSRRTVHTSPRPKIPVTAPEKRAHSRSPRRSCRRPSAVRP